MAGPQDAWRKATSIGRTHGANSDVTVGEVRAAVDRPIDADLRGALLQGKRTRDIELPNESGTIDPRIPGSRRLQYQMDVRDLETPRSMDPAKRRMKTKRMNRYLATPRSMGGGGR